MPSEKTPSKASEARRSTKPIMEKRRRARINSSLAELKNLILDALKKDNARHSKLEKADILEMTVHHLQNMQLHQVAAVVSSDPSVLSKFRAGFGECANEVSRFLSRIEDIDPNSRQRLLNHLANCMNSLGSSPLASAYQSVPTLGPLQPVHIQVPTSTSSSTPSDSDYSRLFGGVQLVPTRLPSGEIAFLLPNQHSTPSLLSVYAPTTVPISPAPTSTSSSPAPSSSVPSPVNVLGSTGILSPASSDRSTITPSPLSPTARSSTSSTSHQPACPVVEVKPDMDQVWRPW